VLPSCCLSTVDACAIAVALPPIQTGRFPIGPSFVVFLLFFLPFPPSDRYPVFPAGGARSVQRSWSRACSVFFDLAFQGQLRSPFGSRLSSFAPCSIRPLTSKQGGCAPLQFFSYSRTPLTDESFLPDLSPPFNNRHTTRRRKPAQSEAQVFYISLYIVPLPPLIPPSPSPPSHSLSSERGGLCYVTDGNFFLAPFSF